LRAVLVSVFALEHQQLLHMQIRTVVCRCSAPCILCAVRLSWRCSALQLVFYLSFIYCPLRPCHLPPTTRFLQRMAAWLFLLNPTACQACLSQ
jgi:hypothetical protein